MNYLKVKYAFYCLLAMFSVSIFMMSCGKDAPILENEIEVVEQATSQIENKGMILPDEIASKGAQAISDHLDNASIEQVTKYVNAFNTVKFVEELGKLDALNIELQNEANIDEIDFSAYFSNVELRELRSKLVSSSDIKNDISRACYGSYQYQCSYCPPVCRSRNVYGQCTGGWTSGGPCNCSLVFVISYCDGHW